MVVVVVVVAVAAVVVAITGTFAVVTIVVLVPQLPVDAPAIKWYTQDTDPLPAFKLLHVGQGKAPRNHVGSEFGLLLQ